MRLGSYYRAHAALHLFLPVKVNSALDVGCHDGFFLSRLDARRRVGIDLHPEATYAGVDYVQGDFMTHDFSGERFDLVTAFDVLEHVPNDRLFLQRLVSNLASGGTAILTTPSDGIRVFPGFLQSYVDRRWDHTIRRGFGKHDLHRLAQAIGIGNETRVEEWAAPWFRWLYFPLSTVWRVAPPVGRAMTRGVVKRDARARSGVRGYYVMTIRRNR